MVYEETSEDVSLEVEADRSHAQILLRVTDSLKAGLEAEKIIRDFGIQVIEKSYLSAQWVLLKLNVKDMRNVVLKLTEQGFVIKGINALA